MKTVNAVRADALDLSPWGRLYDLADADHPDVVSTQGPGLARRLHEPARRGRADIWG